MSRFFALVLALSAVAYGELLAEKSAVNDRRAERTTVLIRDFPYTLNLRKNGVNVCGAALISASWAITAAQCTVDTPIASLTLRAGSADRVSGGQQRTIVLVIEHPYYNPQSASFDISLIRTSSTFDLDDNVRPIAMVDPATVSIDPGTYGVITEWFNELVGIGVTDDELRQVWVPLLPQDTCEEILGSSLLGMLCAGDLEASDERCLGQAGAPFVIQDVLIGITSMVDGCSGPNVPGAYTSIADFRNWIKSHTGI